MARQSGTDIGLLGLGVVRSFFRQLQTASTARVRGDALTREVENSVVGAAIVVKA